MDRPLDELYLQWIYGQVASPRLRDPKKTHWNLLKQLYRKEFVWLVPNDDNRVEDGRALRHRFLREVEVDQVDRIWMEMGCSVLEMLFALSDRLAFEMDQRPRDWFWQLIHNLDLTQYNDAWYRASGDPKVIDEKLDLLIFRNYSRNGSGGLFPLRHPKRDQRGVEIWYQMAAYLLELEE